MQRVAILKLLKNRRFATGQVFNKLLISRGGSWIFSGISKCFFLENNVNFFFKNQPNSDGGRLLSGVQGVEFVDFLCAKSSYNALSPSPYPPFLNRYWNKLLYFDQILSLNCFLAKAINQQLLLVVFETTSVRIRYEKREANIGTHISHLK